MSFLNKILPQKETKEYFLTVGVEESRITAAVSLISGKEVTIVGTGESLFDETSEETEAADIAISEAEKKIGANILVQKVIFGLPLSLIENDKIKPQHLARLKKITNVLSLIPCGFIEYPQALSYYLETKEESPPTLILLSIGKKQITISHIRVGKIEKNITIEKTPSILADFEKSLSRFSPSDILPSRIMLYDESGETKLEDIREELLSFPWHKHSIFLHTPKISTLETAALTYALVEAAAKSLAKELHLEEKTVVSEKIPDEPEKTTEKAIKQEEDFGFVIGKDITQETESEETIQAKDTEEHEELLTGEKKTAEAEDTAENVSIPQRESRLPKLPKFSFSMPQMPQLPSFRFPFITLGISAVLLLGLLFFVFWSFPKATVNLIVYPASSASQTDVVFTTNSDSVKSDKNSILAVSVSTDVSGDKNTSTTGTTKIGERATGTVTIYNKTANSKMFPKGTVLVSDGLKFSLNDDVTVASASDTGEGLAFGKTTSNVTAADIGPGSNLAGGTSFTISGTDQSQYYAKNSDKFSGGTSRDITSVAKDDQDKLLTSLTQDLTSLAKQQLMQKLSAGEKLLDVSLGSSVVSKKFSKNAGDESKDLSLSLALKISGLVYKEADLTSLAKAGQIPTPPGFTIVPNKTNIRIDDAKTAKNGDVVGHATITYYFFPQIDTDKIRPAVSGKSFAEVDRYLHAIQNIGGAEIIYNSRPPILQNILPLRKENINITLVAR